MRVGAITIIAGDVLALVTVGAAPVGAPWAGVRRVGVIVAVRVVALNVGKIIEDFVILAHKLAHLLIVGCQCGAAAVGVPRHIDEAHVRVFRFKLAHHLQVAVHGRAVFRHLPAPRPHKDVHRGIGGVIQIAARLVQKAVGVPGPAIIIGQAQAGRVLLGRHCTPIPDQVVLHAIHLGAQVIGARFELAAVRGMPVKQDDVAARRGQPLRRNLRSIGGGMVNDNGGVDRGLRLGDGRCGGVIGSGRGCIDCFRRSLGHHRRGRRIAAARLNLGRGSAGCQRQHTDQQPGQPAKQAGGVHRHFLQVILDLKFRR